VARFEDVFRVPAPEEVEEEIVDEPGQPPWWGPPRDELGVAVPVSLVVATSETAVVALSHAVVYSVGAAFNFVAVARRLRQRKVQSLMAEQHMWGGGEVADGFIRLGVEFSDGRKASNIEWVYGQQRLYTDTEPEGPVVSLHGNGGGGGNRSRVELHPGLWMWPLPPPGSLKVFAEWPAVGVTIASVEIDAAVFADAAQRVVSL
jgi:hypothetical protein